MNAPAHLPAFDVAKAFQATWRSAIARGEIAGGGLVKASRCDELLVVAVLFMPPGAFDARFLALGPAHDRPLFSPLGETYWLHLHELAHAAAQGADQRDGLAAVFLMPSALDTARERLTLAQAAAA